MIIITSYIFFKNLIQAEATIFIYGITQVVSLTFWCVLAFIPKTKRHAYKVVNCVANVLVGVGINLAYRDKLPFKVDMDNLEVFTQQIQLIFIWTHSFLLADYKWTALLDGPIFLVLSYFEASILCEIKVRNEPTYPVDVKML